MGYDAVYFRRQNACLWHCCLIQQ